MNSRHQRANRDGTAANAATPAIARLMIGVSIAAGAAYPLIEGHFGVASDVLAKGAGVAALAVAALFGRNFWLAAIMAAGALGDVLLELPGLFIAGAAAFATGHVTAIVFYSRHRRAGLGRGDRFTAAALILYGLMMPGLLTPAGIPSGLTTLYSVLLCGMAAACLISRYRAPWAGAGALLFVISDTLLIMRLGGTLIGGPFAHGLAVWYSYYAGQLLIFLGVVRRGG